MRRRPSPGTTAKISESSWAASLQTPPSGAVPPWRCSPGGGPAWALSDLLRGVRDRTKDARLGAMAAGNLLARKRPRPGPDRRQRDRGGVQAETPRLRRGLVGRRTHGNAGRRTEGERRTFSGFTSLAFAGQPTWIIFRCCGFSALSPGCTYARLLDRAARYSSSAHRYADVQAGLRR